MPVTPLISVRISWLVVASTWPPASAAAWAAWACWSSWARRVF